MKALRLGQHGSEVKKWQYFLNGQGYHEVIADGIFGPNTEKATRDFQQNHGLTPDGIVGTYTLTRAGMIGFGLVKNPADENPEGIHWPPKPAFKSWSQHEYCNHCGTFSWKLKPGENTGRELMITCNWESENLVYIDTPFLQNLPPYHTKRIQVHKKAANQFEQLFRHWELDGLANLLLSYDGGYNPRMIRGSENKISSHSYGIAFDINAAWNPLGVIPPKVNQTGSVRNLVEIAHAHGFYWGGHFSRYDGMHFEVARFIH